ERSLPRQRQNGDTRRRRKSEKGSGLTAQGSRPKWKGPVSRSEPALSIKAGSWKLGTGNRLRAPRFSWRSRLCRFALRRGSASALWAFGFALRLGFVLGRRVFLAFFGGLRLLAAQPLGGGAQAAAHTLRFCLRRGF